MATKKLKAVNLKFTPKNRKIIGVGSVIVIVLFVLASLPAIVGFLAKTLNWSNTQTDNIMQTVIPITELAEKLATPVFFGLLGYIGILFIALPALKVLGFLFIGIALVSIFSVLSDVFKPKPSENE